MAKKGFILLLARQDETGQWAIHSDMQSFIVEAGIEGRKFYHEAPTPTDNAPAYLEAESSTTEGYTNQLFAAITDEE